MAGSGGPLALGGLAIAALLAFFWGEDEASAKPGGLKPGPVIAPDDEVGKQEAGTLAAMIDKAVAACPYESLDPFGGSATDSYGIIGPCDFATVRMQAVAIRKYPWTHPAVRAQALEQADALDDLADTGQKVVAANQYADKEAAVLAGMIPKGVCNKPDQACATKLYAAAKAIKAYPWKSQVGQVAWEEALKLEGAAKAIEDDLDYTMTSADYPDNWEQ
jgi:hypothetical protein